MLSFIDENDFVWIESTEDVYECIEELGRVRKIQTKGCEIIVLSYDGILYNLDKCGHCVELENLGGGVDFVSGTKFLCCLMSDNTIKYWDIDHRGQNTIYEENNRVNIPHEDIFSIYLFEQELVLITNTGSVYSSNPRQKIVYDAEITMFEALRVHYTNHFLCLIVTTDGVYFKGSSNYIGCDKYILDYTLLDRMENVVDARLYNNRGLSEGKMLLTLDIEGNVFISGIISQNMHLFDGFTMDNYTKVYNKQISQAIIGKISSIALGTEELELLNIKGELWRMKAGIGWCKVEGVPRIKYLSNSIIPLFRPIQIKSARNT